MIWIVVAILVVGFFIVRAIQQSSAINTLLSIKKIKNTPIYQKKYKGSMEFIEYTGKYLDALEGEYQLELRLLNEDTLNKSGRDSINRQIKDASNEQQDLLNKFNNKYEGADYDPRTDLSTDEYVQSRFRQIQERQEDIGKLSKKILELKRER